jgi:serine/threonine protein kinase
MHAHDPPYAHNDLKPGNVLLTLPKNRPPVAVVTDFGSAGPARRELKTRKEAMEVQVHHSGIWERTFSCRLDHLESSSARNELRSVGNNTQVMEL